MMDAWATTARVFLAAYRSNPLFGDTFEDAWRTLLRKYPPPGGRGRVDGWNSATVAFAKRAFREGYYRRDVIASASIIAEHDDDEPARPGGTVLGMGSVIA